MAFLVDLPRGTASTLLCLATLSLGRKSKVKSWLWLRKALWTLLPMVLGALFQERFPMRLLVDDCWYGILCPGKPSLKNVLYVFHYKTICDGGKWTVFFFCEEGFLAQDSFVFFPCKKAPRCPFGCLAHIGSRIPWHLNQPGCHGMLGLELVSLDSWILPSHDDILKFDYVVL